jgi:flagellar protein FliS
MYGSGISAYQTTDVLTANPKKLVIMCYEGAIRNLKIAKDKHVSAEYEAKAKALQKAQDIIVELTAGLDFEKGGQIAKNLHALYRYMLRRITEGDLKRDVTSIDEVVGMLEELKGAWEEIFYGRKEDVDSVSHLSDGSSAQHATAYGP